MRINGSVFLAENAARMELNLPSPLPETGMACNVADISGACIGGSLASHLDGTEWFVLLSHAAPAICLGDRQQPEAMTANGVESVGTRQRFLTPCKKRRPIILLLACKLHRLKGTEGSFGWAKSILSS